MNSKARRNEHGIKNMIRPLGNSKKITSQPVLFLPKREENSE